MSLMRSKNALEIETADREPSSSVQRNLWSLRPTCGLKRHSNARIDGQFIRVNVPDAAFAKGASEARCDDPWLRSTKEQAYQRKNLSFFENIVKT